MTTESTITNPGVPGGVNFQSPEMLEMLQERLDGLAGRSSGYIENLPLNVQNRIAALKNLQDKHGVFDDQFEMEVIALEKKYHELHFRGIYEQSSKIINGSYEPTEEECARKPSEEDEGETGPVITEIDDSVVGVPEFWLTALKNTRYFQENITEADEPALRYLKDISLEYLTDNPGFALIFTFAENEFFRNTILRKSYHLSKPEDEPGLSLMFDRAEGTIIEWKEGKNLAVTVEAKKQRHKGSQKTRIVKKTVPADTFFEFFTPMAYPEDDSSQDLDEDVMERIEGDYEAGEFIKEKLIPNSVGWFTGDALQYESDESSEFDEEDEGGDSEDEEDSDGETAAGSIAPMAVPLGGEAAANPECKQQ